MYCCLFVIVLYMSCCLLSESMLMCSLPGRGRYAGRRGNIEVAILCLLHPLCSLNVLLFYGYVNACMFLCMCWWLFDVFNDLDQEGLTQDLKTLLEPLAHDEAAEAQCHRECFVHSEIIHLLMLFVFVLISGIAPSRVWWLPSHPHQEESHLDAHC